MKRLVLVHKDGIHQIIGATDGELPITIYGNGGPFEAMGRQIEFASLYRVNTRGAYYREPITPATHTFHEAQK